MDHGEAVELMATERYLLGELSPEQREAFEAHFFECYECALDIRAEAAFLKEAKVQLPQMTQSAAPVEGRSAPVKTQTKRRDWFGWMRPVWAVPAFAALLVVIGYQNLATIPGLRSAADAPRVTPWSTLHVGTRAGAHTAVTADRKNGTTLLIDVPNDGTYTSFGFALENPEGKQTWMETVKAPANGDGTISLSIPGRGLQEGAYTLTIAGITPQGSRTEIERQLLDVRFNEQ
ncbi:MAG TPA: zf-HC2 domain-containing protein [Acidobacteriaceae bacterium]|nr:zf-HC2 domain-containing protein [Acidobacteriaceae bacterium]